MERFVGREWRFSVLVLRWRVMVWRILLWGWKKGGIIIWFSKQNLVIKFYPRRMF